MTAIIEAFLRAAARETFDRLWHHSIGRVDYPLVNAAMLVAHSNGRYWWERAGRDRSKA